VTACRFERNTALGSGAVSTLNRDAGSLVLRGCTFAGNSAVNGGALGGGGRDLAPPETLTAVIRRCADERMIERLRLSSIEPHEVTDELITLMGSSGVVCRHLHIPLQSGDDGILAACAGLRCSASGVRTESPCRHPGGRRRDRRDSRIPGRNGRCLHQHPPPGGSDARGLSPRLSLLPTPRNAGCGDVRPGPRRGKVRRARTHGISPEKSRVRVRFIGEPSRFLSRRDDRDQLSGFSDNYITSSAARPIAGSSG
jgi:hypothetical protein